MDISELQGITSAFYFIPANTHGPHDPPYDMDDPRIRELIRRIHSRGHEIGLHPGYRTYRDPVTLRVQVKRLRAVCEEEAVTQAEWGGRMHYLQWAMDVTPGAWEQAGMAYDSTFGYADHAGLRFGTCHDFVIYSLNAKKTLDLRERPLIAIEGTLLSPKYMAMKDTN